VPGGRGLPITGRDQGAGRKAVDPICNGHSPACCPVVRTMEGLVSSQSSYQQAVQAYVDAARVLFAPPGQRAGKRGGRGPTSFEELGTRAQTLSVASSDLAQAAAARLRDPLPAVREESASALLAKGLADLETSAFLFQSARDQEVIGAQFLAQRSSRRSAAVRGVEPALRVLLGEEPAVRVHRGRALRGLETARSQLLIQADDSLALIIARAVASAKSALQGLIGLGTGELARAVGVLGMNVASALGQADKVGQLHDLFRDFLVKAYESFVALLGPGVARFVGEQVADWVKGIAEGEAVADLLERLYAAKETRMALEKRIKASEASLPSFESASAELTHLTVSFSKQTGLVHQILPKLKWVALIPPAALPQATLLLAATYIALSGYVILAAGDYVDAPRLQRFGRVPGVRRVIESQLGQPRVQG
jgi:hypothetical protein